MILFCFCDKQIDDCTICFKMFINFSQINKLQKNVTNTQFKFLEHKNVKYYFCKV